MEGISCHFSNTGTTVLENCSSSRQIKYFSLSSALPPEESEIDLRVLQIFRTLLNCEVASVSSVTIRRLHSDVAEPTGILPFLDAQSSDRNV